MVERVLTIEDIAKAESEFTPGNVPEPIWLEHLRLNGVVTIEITPYKIINGKVQVFMTRRSPNDPLYANQYHMPGTMVNGNDESENEPIERIRQKEMAGFILGIPEKVSSFIRKTPRGTEGVFMYTMQVYEGGKQENWFDVDNLPNDTIEIHKKMIAIARDAITSKGQKRQTVAFE